MKGDSHWDAVVVGAGAAGLFCAALAGQNGRRVLLTDHAETIAEKIRISGGGRCNFTNRDLDPRRPEQHFISQNPKFCRSALARYTPADFVALVVRHGLGFEEKHKGQLFCQEGSGAIIDLLLDECERGRVTRWQPCAVMDVESHPAGGGAEASRFTIATTRGKVTARSLVVATGGLSIPKIGASDFGYRLARQWGHRIVEPRPALVPLTFTSESWAPFAALSGLSLPVVVRCEASDGSRKSSMRFVEDLLFTHRGLSGPAILQISSYWNPGEMLHFDLLPDDDIEDVLLKLKTTSRRHLRGVLAQYLPERLAHTWALPEGADDRPLNELPDRTLREVAKGLHDWVLTPAGSEGFRKAEVTRGGVDTRELSSQTLESKRQPGLYFIGEVVDVTGWLGGYNFQWAWSSAHACAQAL